MIKKRKEKRAVRLPLFFHGRKADEEVVRDKRDSKDGMGHIPEDRHKHGLVLDFSLENNIVLQRYWQPEFQKGGLITRVA